MGAFYAGIVAPLKQMSIDHDELISVFEAYGIGWKELHYLQQLLDFDDGKISLAHQFSGMTDNKVVDMFQNVLLTHKNPTALIEV